MTQQVPDLFWASALPLEHVPPVLDQLATLTRALTTRLIIEPIADPHKTSPPLLTALAMAARLGVPESWVRGEQRAGRIPFVQCGRYIRFRPEEVEAAIAARPPKKR